jgi:REP element-mobilizing transposase RayT
MSVSCVILTRLTQNSLDFKCHAHQPILAVTNSSGIKTPDFSGGLNGINRQKSFLKYLRSDKIKYKKTLALQKLDRDPDGVYVELKYHFVWNVIYRRPVFHLTDDIFDDIYDTFLRCSELVGGIANLLWLASDHLHLYVESDGELSVEKMVQEIKEYSKYAMLSELTSIKEKTGTGNIIWDESYYSETIG